MSAACDDRPREERSGGHRDLQRRRGMGVDATVRRDATTGHQADVVRDGAEEAQIQLLGEEVGVLPAGRL